MLSESEAEDTEEGKAFGLDKQGDEMADDLRDRNSRISRSKACKERLEQEKAEARPREAAPFTCTDKWGYLSRCFFWTNFQ